MIYFDCQKSINLIPCEEGYSFSYDGERKCFETKEKIYQFFLNSPFDTIIFSQGEAKEYQHNILKDEYIIYEDKTALRQRLSAESQGSWVEKRKGEKRYLIDESSWWRPVFRKVSKVEFMKRDAGSSISQKILSAALGALALTHGVMPSQSSNFGTDILPFDHSSLIRAGLCGFYAQIVMAQNKIDQETVQLPSGNYLEITRENGKVLAIQRFSELGEKIGEEFQVSPYFSDELSIPKQISQFENEADVSNLEEMQEDVVYHSTIPSLGDLKYNERYSFGLPSGTFVIRGGNGVFNPENSNTLEIYLEGHPNRYANINFFLFEDVPSNFDSILKDIVVFDEFMGYTFQTQRLELSLHESQTGKFNCYLSFPKDYAQDYDNPKDELYKLFFMLYPFLHVF